MGVGTTMTVVLAHSAEADSLKFERRDVPKPGADEVVLTVSAAGITSGELSWPESYPFVPAHDVAGNVVLVGSSVTGFAHGDEVYGLVDFDRDGALSEYVVVPAASIAPAPRTLDPVRAASIPLGALTAWQALVDHAGVQPGQHVLVHGGAGGVGAYAVQLARHLGARVTATARATDAGLVSHYGAETVVDYAGTFEDEISEVDVVLDTAGGDTIARSWALIRDGGVLVSVAEEPTAPADSTARAVYFVVEPHAGQLTELARLVDAGALRPALGRVVPFDQAHTVFATDGEGHHPGKTVIEFTGDPEDER